MTEEVDVMAEELAKTGGITWFPGRQRRHSTVGLVTEHYRARARVVLATLDRLRGRQEPDAPDHGGMGRPGATVIYRPAGERRAYPCRVVEIRGERAYLAPIIRLCVGWVSVERLEPAPDGEAIDHQQTRQPSPITKQEPHHASLLLPSYQGLPNCRAGHHWARLRRRSRGAAVRTARRRAGGAENASAGAAQAVQDPGGQWGGVSDRKSASVADPVLLVYRNYLWRPQPQLIGGGVTFVIIRQL